MPSLKDRGVKVHTAAHEPIAVVGLACRAPGASNAAAYWRNIRDGVVSLTSHSREDLLRGGASPALTDQQDFVPVGGYLPDAALFDADFFGMSAREARITDPQHRLLLELAWEGLEDAGYDPLAWGGRIGCFAGAGMTLYAGAEVGSYLVSNVLADPTLVAKVAVPQIAMANLADYLATKVAYRLNLRGPALTLQTACSTGLVAIHMAKSSLLLGECDLAIAGATAIHTPLEKGYLADGGILSPHGVCRPFDQNAAGTVGGAGGGVVLLRRLSDALADGDDIRAVILGSAINNDGSNKVSYTAPSFQGQCDVIERALAAAGVDPVTIGYIETHGTGTRLGDAVELASLAEIYGSSAGGSCALGAVKANIGHLDTAAGAMGFIKAVMALEQRTIPVLSGLESVNPELQLERTPFFAPTRSLPWGVAPDGRRRAAVSSFGAGGTNAHMVLEEAPQRAIPQTAPAEPQLITVSAKSASALAARLTDLADALDAAPERRLSDVAFTCAVGRAHHPYRAAVVAASPAEAAKKLRTSSRELAGGGVSPRPKERRSPKVAFVFPGQGGLGLDALKHLYLGQAVFRATFDACAQACSDEGLNLLAVVKDDGRELRTASLIQPTLVAAQLALAELWASWGVRPAAVLGHSLGEYAAACVAGAFGLADCMRLVARRGALMDTCCSPGGMTAVTVPAAVAEAAIARLGLMDQASVAAFNTPNSTVIAGSDEARAAVCRLLEEGGATSLSLSVSHAFHSPLMDPVLGLFGEAARRVSYSSASIPFHSTVSGMDLRTLDDVYWTRQIRDPVRFSAAVSGAFDAGCEVFLDLGVGSGLETVLRKNLGAQSAIVPSIGRGRAETGAAEALGRLYTAGIDPDWNAIYAEGETHGRIPLPTYPFERQRYWVDPPRERPSVSTVTARRPGPSAWTIGWDLAEPLADPHGRCDEVLLLSCGSRAALSLRDHLALGGAAVDFVQFCGATEQVATAMSESIRIRKRLPRMIVLCLGAAEPGADSVSLLRDAADQAWLATRLVQVVLHQDVDDHDLIVVTTTIEHPGGEPYGPGPPQMGVWGAMRSARRELSGWSIQLHDIDQEGVTIAPAICRRIAAGGEAEICWRGGEAYSAILAPYSPASGETRLDGQAVLITGGRGGLGLAIANGLLDRGAKTLVIVSRSPPAEGSGAPPSRPAQTVVHVTADVGAEDFAAKLGAALADHGGVLDGVVHAAGVLQDAALVRQNPESLIRALSPKLGGALNLLVLARSFSIKWIDVLSSAGSVLGSPGQVNYAAANAAMSSLFLAGPNELRTRILHLGPVGGGGMETGRGGEDGFAFCPMAAQELVERIGRLDGREVLIATLKPGEAALASAILAAAAFARRVWKAEDPQTSVRDPITPVGAATRFARQDLLDRIVAEVSALTGEAEDGLDPSIPIFDLGLDSLMIMTLRRRLSKVIGLPLSTEVFFDASTLQGLATAIDAMLRPGEAAIHNREETR